jgi:hypothetical protein
MDFDRRCDGHGLTRVGVAGGDGRDGSAGLPGRVKANGGDDRRRVPHAGEVPGTWFAQAVADFAPRVGPLFLADHRQRRKHAQPRTGRSSSSTRTRRGVSVERLAELRGLRGQVRLSRAARVRPYLARSRPREAGGWTRSAAFKRHLVGRVHKLMTSPTGGPVPAPALR